MGDVAAVGMVDEDAAVEEDEVGSGQEAAKTV